MEFFLVGGAVRDELLNYPVIERDWVAVNASPEQMLALGYIPVGKDFSVFLHPSTKEEYALARTERKTGHGYTGFSVYAAPDVTLEQDLARRDLTINAIAKNEAGELIDPYGGQADIAKKLLRHVSAAFEEDPVRILRVARFAARYHHLGFTVAPQTQTLMQKMVSHGEVDHLVPERVWKEFSRALDERHPEIFIAVLRECGALKRLLPEVDDLFGVPQRKEYHPEIDTGIHTMLALQCACALSAKTEVRFATLMHDLGKAKTPADILPRHHGHETRSLPLIKNLCARLAVPNPFRDLALNVAEFHTHAHRANELTPATVVKTLTKIDAFRRPERFAQFLLCCEADARGRTGFEDRPYPQAEYLAAVHKACANIDAKPLVDQGLSGAAIGEQIHKQRLHAANVTKQQWETHFE